MTIRIIFRFLFAMTLLAACGLASPTIHAARSAGQAPDAEAHKQWMNDASDAQDDYRFAVSNKNDAAAVEALQKLEGLMANTEAYWTAGKSADGVKMAKQARSLAAAAAAAAKTGGAGSAQALFDKLSTSCNACHELHLEKP